jgi:signal transduction histidine kinase
VRALGGERVRNQQLVLVRADGTAVPVAAHAAPLGTGADSALRAIAVLQDVTQVRQAEQLKDDFLALISHEFRTPLTSIHGGAHLLASGGDDLPGETRAELLADVVTESERLDRMLGNILSLADVLAGRLRAATEPVLVAPLARRVAAEVGARSPAHAFTVAVGADLPAVEADPDLLEEVLRNLYENAVKYAPEGGEVRTTAERNDEAIAIRVADRGIGIAPEHVGAVFERFRRVGGDPTVRGMGLGLYLSRHLVEAQGGTIGISSLGIGHGATITVTLPVARGWAVNADAAAGRG